MTQRTQAEPRAARRRSTYRSFDYLEAGTDFVEFTVSDGADRVPSWRVPLDADQEARVSRLRDECIMVSLHEHLGAFPEVISETPDYIRQGRMATAFRGLDDYGFDAVFDNLMDGVGRIESQSGWKWTEVLHDLGMRLCDLAHQDNLMVARSVDDIMAARASGRVAWIAAQEGAAMIENEVDRIEVLYGFGLRMLGVTYSEANALGSGLKEPRDGGLTAFGKKAVARMNKVGMIVDLSHAGDQTARDTIEYSDHPVTISHIGARALWDSRRLAPDDVMVACAAKGGLVGIEAAPHTTITPTHPRHGLESYMEHFEYIRALVGIDHVGFGPDAVFGDHVGLHDTYAGGLSLKESRGGTAGDAAGGHPRVEYVQGLENPTEASHNILRWLVAKGYSDEDIAKVTGGNALRIMGQVWG